MQDLEEATAHANNTFKERIRSDIKEYRENTHKYKNSTRKYFPEIMSYKGINIIPKMEENAVQLSLMAKMKTIHSLLLIFLTEDRM